MAMGTAIKHAVPDWVKLSFVIFDIRALWHSTDVKNYKCRLNPVWHSMLYNCTHMATVHFKGLGTEESLCEFCISLTRCVAVVCTSVKFVQWSGG